MFDEITSRPDPALLARLAEYTVATIHEAQDGKGAVDAHIKPLDPSMRFIGVARTVLSYPGDNLTVQAALDSVQPGDVVVVNSGSAVNFGQFGDVLATGAKTRGAAAFITDSGVRDSGEIRELGFPVFAASVSINGTRKDRLGYVNIPIPFGGTIITPGDVIVGDVDGIVVVDPSTLETLIEACKERVEKEDHIRDDLFPAGESILKIGGHTEKVQRLLQQR